MVKNKTKTKQTKTEVEGEKQTNNRPKIKHRVQRVKLFVAADLPQPLPRGLTEFCPTTNLDSETSLEGEKTGDTVETERTETNRRDVEQSGKKLETEKGNPSVRQKET